MQTSIACVFGMVSFNTICIDGRGVSTSDSESAGPGSIPMDANRTFFSFFLLLEVIKFFFLSLHFKVE